VGLYTGWIGLGLVAARIGTILGEEELLQAAERLLRRLEDETPRDKHNFDLISGCAGAIVGLLGLQQLLNNPSPLDLAMRWGDELLHIAKKTDHGYSWGSVECPSQHHLTGFSHGAAGAGYALIELFCVTDDPKYLRAAQYAFQYENHWFDSSEHNWPDFRELPSQVKRDRWPLSFTTYWCHGAPGIALSRLRAYETLHENRWRIEALIALDTTRRMVEKTLYSGIESLSLCHGLCGNAEVLLYGQRVLGNERAEDSELIREVAEVSAEVHTNREQSWLSGATACGIPGLLIGLAGVGYFYLRLQNPATPSVLIWRPEDFQNQLSHSSRHKDRNWPTTT